jgi:hypothetical protein
MAARLNRKHSEEVRAKIQASALVYRLNACAMGEVEMTATQVKAAEALLDRSVPKLSQIQHVGDEDGGPVKVSFTWKTK